MRGLLGSAYRRASAASARIRAFGLRSGFRTRRARSRARRPHRECWRLALADATIEGCVSRPPPMCSPVTEDESQWGARQDCEMRIYHHATRR